MFNLGERQFYFSFFYFFAYMRHVTAMCTSSATSLPAIYTLSSRAKKHQLLQQRLHSTVDQMTELKYQLSSTS
jgi:hypothetical protein